MTKIKSIIGGCLFAVLLCVLTAISWAKTSGESFVLFVYFGILVVFCFGYIIIQLHFNEKKQKQQAEDLSTQITTLLFNISELKQQLNSAGVSAANQEPVQQRGENKSAEKPSKNDIPAN